MTTSVAAAAAALLRRAETALRSTGVPAAAAEAAALWRAAGGDRGAFGDMVARRARREPLQLILGTAPFHELELAVAPGVFIPRFETEGLAELALASIMRTPAPAVVELFAGVGPAAVLIAKRRPDARVAAVEVDERAAALIRRNAAAYGVDVNVIVGDVRDDAVANRVGPVDLVVVNPPYIPSAEIDALPPEVRDWEPRAALDGGGDGLAFYPAVAAFADRYLKAGGAWAVEIGERQGVAAAAFFAPLGPAEIHKDLAGRDRYLVGKKV